VDYGTSEAKTTLGRIGVKVWVYKGDKVAERTAPPRSAVERARAAGGEPPEAGAPVPAGPERPSEGSPEVAAEAPAETAAPAVEPEAVAAPEQETDATA
jgi:small subunit ribosomal protein S3